MGNIFDSFKMSNEETQFINNVAEADNMNHNLAFIEKKQFFSTFYLAKQIEASGKSNDKHSKRMFWLTVAIVVFSAVQFVELILKLLNVI